MCVLCTVYMHAYIHPYHQHIYYKGMIVSTGGVANSSLLMNPNLLEAAHVLDRGACGQCISRGKCISVSVLPRIPPSTVPATESRFLHLVPGARSRALVSLRARGWWRREKRA